jgi:hypothetical protein
MKVCLYQNGYVEIVYALIEILARTSKQLINPPFLNSACKTVVRRRPKCCPPENEMRKTKWIPRTPPKQRHIKKEVKKRKEEQKTVYLRGSVRC